MFRKYLITNLCVFYFHKYLIMVYTFEDILILSKALPWNMFSSLASLPYKKLFWSLNHFGKLILVPLKLKKCRIQLSRWKKRNVCTAFKSFFLILCWPSSLWQSTFKNSKPFLYKPHKYSNFSKKERPFLLTFKHWLNMSFDMFVFKIWCVCADIKHLKLFQYFCRTKVFFERVFDWLIRTKLQRTIQSLHFWC